MRCMQCMRCLLNGERTSETRELVSGTVVLFLMGCGEEAVTPGQVVGGDGEAYAAIAQGQPGSASGTTRQSRLALEREPPGNPRGRIRGFHPVDGMGNPGGGRERVRGQTEALPMEGARRRDTGLLCTSNEEHPAETPLFGRWCVRSMYGRRLNAGNTCNLSICVPRAAPFRPWGKYHVTTCETGEPVGNLDLSRSPGNMSKRCMHRCDPGHPRARGKTRC